MATTSGTAGAAGLVVGGLVVRGVVVGAALACPPAELRMAAAATDTAASPARTAIHVRRRRFPLCGRPAVGAGDSSAVCAGSRGAAELVIVGSQPTPSAGGEETPAVAAGGAYRLSTSVSGAGSQSAESWAAPSSASKSAVVGR
jgi:hypothetical protein